MLQNLPAYDSSLRGGVAGFGLEATCFQRKYFMAVEMHGYESICGQSPKEAIVKTGNTANHQGLYSSECCDFEVTFERGQTLTRCPKCSALTVWDLAEEPVKKAA